MKDKNYWVEEGSRLKAALQGISPLVEEALEYFEWVHLPQFRDDGIEPYDCHTKRVAGAVHKRGMASRYVIAALGHDSLEDQPDRAKPEVIADFFGKEVLADIIRLTNIDKIAPMMKPLSRPVRKYLAAQQLAGAPLEVKLIKIEDRWDNVHSPMTPGKEVFYKTKYTIETQELMAAMWEIGLDGDPKYKELTKWSFPQK